MDVKLSDAELTVMNLLWEQGEVTAVDLARQANAERGWEKNTTYTLIGRLIKKKAVERRDPGFHCKALIDRETVGKKEGRQLVDKLFHGSLHLFAKAFLEDTKLTPEERAELQKIIDRH